MRQNRNIGCGIVFEINVTDREMAPFSRLLKKKKKKEISKVSGNLEETTSQRYISTKIRNSPKVLFNEVNKLTQPSADLSDQVPLDQWYAHFTSVFSSISPSTKLSYRELLYKHFSQLNPYKNQVYFTPSSILTQIISLKCGKAPGPDGLLPEHLMYGTSKLLEYLMLLFQIIVTHHYVPSLMGDGIRKKFKDLSQYSSYIPITLCSVISKLFEKNLLPYLTKKRDMRDQQLGFRSGVGVQTHRELA